MIAAILVLLAGTGTGSWWFWNAHAKPRRTCPQCEGEKYVPVRTWGGPERFKICPKCDGHGSLLKWQARRSMARQERRAALAPRPGRAS